MKMGVLGVTKSILHNRVGQRTTPHVQVRCFADLVTDAMFSSKPRVRIIAWLMLTKVTKYALATSSRVPDSLYCHLSDRILHMQHYRGAQHEREVRSPYDMMRRGVEYSSGCCHIHHNSCPFMSQNCSNDEFNGAFSLLVAIRSF